MRKKVFASIVFLVTMLFAVVGWAAVYYLSPSGSATPPYDTWEKAANSLNQILNLDLTGENTIYVGEGTYSGGGNRILLNDSKHSNLSIIGMGRVEEIIFNPGTDYSSLAVRSSVTNVHFKNITVVNNASYVVELSSATNIEFINCNLIGLDTHDVHIVYIKGSSIATLKYCKVWTNSYSTDYVFYIANDSSVQLNYCSYCSPNGSANSILYHGSTNDVTVTNCIFAKCKLVPVIHAGSGDLTIFNSIIMGGGWRYIDYHTIHRDSSAGSTSVCNSVILPSTFYPANFFSDGVTTENTIQADPTLKPFGTIGFIIPRVDDTANIDYATALADVLKEYGYKGTWFVDVRYATSSYLDQLRSLIQEGVMEVAAHTYSHTVLTYDHALHFEYTGSDTNPTVELDSSRIIHLRTDGSDDVDIDTTQSDADTLGKIINHYSGTNNWIISKSSTGEQQPDHIGSNCRSEALAEMAATAAPCDIDFLKETNCEDGNCEGFYKTEIYEPRIDLTNAINSEGNITDPQTGQIYETKTFVPPCGEGDENVIEALRTSGYLGAGGINSFRDETLPYNVFKISTINAPSLVAEGDEEQTTRNAELFATNVAIDGLVVTLLAHNESDATLEEWRWILNGLKRARKHYNIQVTSLQLAIEALKRLGTYDPSTGDVDIQWAMPSFRLGYDSPCIDAGTKLSIHDSDWQDLAGNTVRYGTAPDIGCYEYKTWPTGAWGMLPWMGGRHKVQWTPYE